MNAKYFAFSDESQYCHGRFGSISCISFPASSFDGLTEELLEILNSSKVKEFKWANLSSAKYRFAAIALLEFCVQNAVKHIFRIDTLIWDRTDGRHDIKDRDEIVNFQIMYYHLFVDILNKRWPTNANWYLYPDVNSAVDWNLLEDLASISSKHDKQYFIKELINLDEKFQLSGISPSESLSFPLIQLADLFAGLSTFSHDKYERYINWLKRKSSQLNLFEENIEISFTNSEKERFIVLERFNSICKNFKLGVSLDSKQGLWTPKPENPINFWIYTPQSPLDKAPKKQ